MSADFYTFFGPYLVVKNRRMPVSQSYFGCPSIECEKHGQNSPKNLRFCAACGTKNTDASADELRLLDLDGEILAPSNRLEHHVPENDEQEDENVDERMEMFFSNDDKLWRKVDIGCDPEMVTECPPEKAQQDIVTFEKLYASEIAALKKALGEGAVRVTWGVHTYCSY